MHNPGRGLRTSRTDSLDARVRVRGAQHITARLAREAHIVDVATPAAKQPRVFLAPDVIADLLYAHASFAAVLGIAVFNYRQPWPLSRKPNLRPAGD
jgi:hypothetical protein